MSYRTANYQINRGYSVSAEAFSTMARIPGITGRSLTGDRCPLSEIFGPLFLPFDSTIVVAQYLRSGPIA
jgi:hypothetical protein